MEKSKSFPQYSVSYSGEFDFDDQPKTYNFNGPSNKGAQPQQTQSERIISMGDEVASGGGCLLLLKKLQPYLAIVSLQFGYAGMYVISLVSMKHGMSHYVLATYRHVVAFVLIAPFAFFLERKIRPKMTLSIFLKIAILGFLEPVFDQNLYYLGMKYTSATFASATVNILPAITFIMALIFRLEKVNVKKVHSMAKVVGTAITVSGAMVMTLYKGPIINIVRSGGNAYAGGGSEASDQHWVSGTVMVIASCFGWSSFFILQSFTLKQYPAELSLTALICMMGMLEGSVATLVMERKLSVWAIGWDSRLLAATYSGVVCSGIAYYVQGVLIRERGPVFVTSFSPLCMIITAVLGFIVLSELVYLGSIIGAILIVAGLYTVVWGKSKDPLESQKAQDGPQQKTFELPLTNTNVANGGKVTNNNTHH